ncbi:M23 family metallopeptidase [Burkholderia sp. PAMC 26561]|uniref:Putative kinase n=2 Tax=Caballeronia sordidicola TaxID=196367 RepID=A0A242N0B8_CABSO|nr:M23 family metallopeptidase [Burkholderia sp. PAMC 26561]AME26584.2 hypothetical protein AXG89_22285 [Burkholderia sp. PAMC 26561]OTP77127.1 putative kinase [Caballeronia sordidicola]
MIISPPYLPDSGRTSNDESSVDPMMDAVDAYEATDGLYPIAADRRWHTGMHLVPKMYNEHIHAIADGEVIAYRVCQRAYDGGSGTPDTNAGFVLLRHTTETGEGRTLTFYSLYMHLLDLNGYHSLGADGKFLPEFLRMPSPCAGAASPIVPPAQSGEGKKVRRKDVLGLTGRCQEHPHLHVEIFMTKPDFEAYFGHTQLGREQVATPATTDYWGSSYYVIPPGQQFYPVPPGTDAKGSLHGIAFDRLHTGNNEDPLYVESHFHKGSKYTMVWRAAGQGKLEALTETLVREADYEYNMYKRAMALYPDCPSDGYEMLRFGRILSTPVTLAPAARGTWVRVSFAEGQEGYIDVSQTSILKLSDADFPFLKGWKKISEGAGLHSADGLCDIDALKKILSDTKARETAEEKAERAFYNKEDELVRYVKTHEPIRDALRGFVCEAPSEWDGSHNEAKFRKLKEVGEFYDGNEAGYNKFIKLLESLQFWDKTGLPAGEKLWFFHPMAFIRHFRKCGWLSKGEFEQIYSNGHYARVRTKSPAEVRATYLPYMNIALRKYGLNTAVRQAHFLGQGAVESEWLSSMQETSMLGNLDASGFHGTVLNDASIQQEAELGHWYGELSTEDDAWFRSVKFNSKGARIAGSYDWKNGNCDREDAQKYRGRGFKQLTGRSNYADYWVFRGWLSVNSFSPSWWTDRSYVAHNRFGMTKQPAQMVDPHRVSLVQNCIDSGGFYMRCKRPAVAREIDRDAEIATTASGKAREQRIVRSVTHAINGGYLDESRRLSFTRIAKEVLM